MEYTSVYKCLGHPDRLRIIALLLEGPLCVCHLMEILGEDQVAVSKQLRYLKANGLVAVEQVAQWRVYRLTEPRHPLLEVNLTCLRQHAGRELGFQADAHQRRAVIKRVRREDDPCAAAVLTGREGG